ncbi:hypothetical protein [Alloalcanivorax marinus]|uniref:hypothetical protein n=1 Tax=Alloalcanivorax marinus TaxID=1177169 RepID=UPI00195C9F61|nr:hypothetical protein [Alloalcanivorax marinus]MBM7334524.1 hypothetical protein [Alloalcanivorax marinus]
MKSITHLHFGLQKLAVRLFGGVSTRADKQRGVSALEYIVLAAAIIFIVGILSTNTTVQTTVKDAFDNLFKDAAGTDGGGGGGTT